MKKLVFAVLFFNTIVFFSCISQDIVLFVPVPDRDYSEPEKTINIGSITGTMDEAAVTDMPDWLLAFINGGIKEVENLGSYNDKYVFIGSSEGTNFTALSRWADYFSVEQDFYIFAAARIERKMMLAAALYPDDEYGEFFETMVKKAYSYEYPGAVKEDVYWIKVRVQEDDGIEPTASSEIFIFYVLLSIEKTALQSIILDMMTETIVTVTPTSAQRSTINRLRRTFFEEF